MAQLPLTARRWTRAEYDRLVDLGVFEGEPLELIDGELVVAEPQGSRHSTIVGLVKDALRGVLPAGWTVRTQMPVALDDESAPEPDVVVVRGRHTDYIDHHPTRPALLVEVADDSLSFDRRRKGSLYARARIADYWIVNVNQRVLEVYRDPAPDAAATYGWRYQSIETLAPPAVVTLLALPDVSVAVVALLP
jgi:Uma2 family endonuclease